MTSARLGGHLTRRGLLLGLTAAIGVGLLLALILSAGSSGDRAVAGAFDGRTPRLGVADRVRVLVELRRPSLGERLRTEALGDEQQQRYVRSLEAESRALQSALRAKGVGLERTEVFSRTWTGFAATVDTDDVPSIGTLGARVQPVRRFYPAAAEHVPASRGELAVAAPRTGPAPSDNGAAAVALVDTGVELSHPALDGRVSAGHDAVGGDSDPSPARAEQHGTALAGVLVDELAPGQRVLAVRVAARQRDAESGTRAQFARTDQLIAGLERALDPDGDGDVTDRPRVVLVGLNPPYAGFARTPEARSVGSIRGAGTLVVAPAGNEGAGGSRFGTVGSPGAAPAALAAAALGDSGPGAPAGRLGLATGHGRATLDGILLAGGERPVGAPVASLVGPSQAAPGASGRALGGRPLEYFDVDARSRARGRIVVVPEAGRNGRPPIAAVAQAAASAGAVGLVVCGPDVRPARQALPLGSAGGIPVLLLTGDDAERALELTRSAGGLAFLAMGEPESADGDSRPTSGSSRGPTYALGLKPDLAAPGAALAPVPGGGAAPIAGTSVAAARVTAVAARVPAMSGGRPATAADRVAAALIGTASFRGPQLAAGAGEASAGRAGATPVVATPHALSFGRLEPGSQGAVTRDLAVFNRGPGTLALELPAELGPAGFRAAVTPRRLSIRAGRTGRARVRITAPRAVAFAAGRILIRGAGRELSVPLGAASGPPPPARVGALRLVREGGRARGVRFRAGSASSEGGRLAVEPVERLRLELRGPSSRELTPPGGATDLLPGEYAFTLTRDVLDELAAGRYRFLVRAAGPARGARLSRSSPSFDLSGGGR